MCQFLFQKVKLGSWLFNMACCTTLTFLLVCMNHKKSVQKLRRYTKRNKKPSYLQNIVIAAADSVMRLCRESKSTSTWHRSHFGSHPRMVVMTQHPGVILHDLRVGLNCV